MSVWFSDKEDGVVFSFDVGNESFPSIIFFCKLIKIKGRELDLRL